MKDDQEHSKSALPLPAPNCGQNAAHVPMLKCTPFYCQAVPLSGGLNPMPGPRHKSYRGPPFTANWRIL